PKYPSPRRPLNQPNARNPFKLDRGPLLFKGLVLVILVGPLLYLRWGVVEPTKRYPPPPPVSGKALDGGRGQFVAAENAAAESPAPVEADVVLRDCRVASGETLPEVRMHYRTVGKPERDRDGKVTNAVLILHGTTGSGANFVGKGRPDDWFAGELFGKGQPL